MLPPNQASQSEASSHKPLVRLALTSNQLFALPSSFLDQSIPVRYSQLKGEGRFLLDFYNLTQANLVKEFLRNWGKSASNVVHP